MFPKRPCSCSIEFKEFCHYFWQEKALFSNVVILLTWRREGGMSDFWVNGNNDTICGKGSMSTLGLSWHVCQNFSFALAASIAVEWVTQNLGPLGRKELISRTFQSNETQGYLASFFSQWCCLLYQDMVLYAPRIKNQLVSKVCLDTACFQI